ncbi:MAG: leucyl/phenylalanyl-tRNA--protein transferase [Pseudohongiellaceae bacterium]
MPLPWLDPDHVAFPPTATALDEPNGLLAVGGALTPAWLEAAYERGIFPWFEEGQPVLWWSPDPRLVLFPSRLHVSRSLQKFIKKTSYVVTMDRNFADVVRACAAPRSSSDGTWITASMASAYGELHRAGSAHSVEVWDAGALIGGLYGVARGRAFFGESMFSRRDNASKLALVALARQLQQWGFELIDCQVRTRHLLSMGAQEISRAEFERRLASLVGEPMRAGPWQFDAPLDASLKGLLN